MQLVAYISDLLYRHDCVVVPEFGAFLTRRVSAQYFESSNSFYPPKKGFPSIVKSFKMMDYLLIMFLALRKFLMLMRNNWFVTRLED
ncbi:hypothetical protein JCM19294_2929 [Nonlabens tegetincola]|uniref:CCDC81-like prokaryotic HU domain-containing protein n=1 Tax=Nonlabens tegetincola TaxID=323273 RepID=A0A090Q1S1_9FLAO|nr:hypothetical protein [Nonlabens tegetincola]GAK96147.1 hypothetical protein JCM19294_2929 [Nonlabens tegetincola]